MDKTLKIRAFPADAKKDAAQRTQAKDQGLSLELAKNIALLEEEKKKSLEYSKTIEQLRESLRLEQSRTADMVKKKTVLESKVKELAALDANEIAKKSDLLDEEKTKSLESMKVIMKLRESLRMEQAKTVLMIKKSAESEAKIKELTEVLSNITSMAKAGKSA